MQLRQFGSTGLEVSPLGLGTVKLGRNKGLRHAAFELPDDGAARRLLGLAADLGINLLDTAPAYGVSEERLGTLLDGERRRWVISTKAGEEFDNATGVSRFDYSAQHIRWSVERSLRRLRTDFLDIVLLHSNGKGEATAFADALGALSELRSEGKLRAFGISSKTVEGGLLALDDADCAMVAFNPDYANEQPVLEKAAEAGKGILVKKPFASGTLAAQGTQQIEQTFGFILSQPVVSSVLVGTIDPDHLRIDALACEQALKALGSGSLP